ncbi:MAG: hypothetical protein WBF66_11625 [Dehalococcoidia bacterium]
MKKVGIYLLIVVALVAGAAFVACGDEEEEAAPPAATTEAEAPTEAETEEAVVEEEEEEAEEEEEDAGEAASIADVPVYPGAKKIQSGEWSGGEAAIPMLGAPVEAEEYGTIEFAMFETGDSADEVFSFYKDEMGDWEELWTFSGSGEEAVGMGIWTKDDGKVAAWVVVGEEDGTTSLMIAVGHE